MQREMKKFIGQMLMGIKMVDYRLNEIIFNTTNYLYEICF